MGVALAVRAAGERADGAARERAEHRTRAPWFNPDLK